MVFKLKKLDSSVTKRNTTKSSMQLYYSIAELNLVIFIASNSNIQQFHETLIFLNLFRKNDIFFKITWWMKTILTIKTKISTH